MNRAKTNILRASRSGWTVAGVALVLLLAASVRSQQAGNAADTAPGRAPATPTASADVAPAIGLTPLQEARDLVEVLEARLNIKKAELSECEVHLSQARRRLATIERIQQLDYQQAIERVRWAEGMYKKGYYSEGFLKADRRRAQELNPNTTANSGAKP